MGCLSAVEQDRLVRSVQSESSRRENPLGPQVVFLVNQYAQSTWKADGFNFFNVESPFLAFGDKLGDIAIVAILIRKEGVHLPIWAHTAFGRLTEYTISQIRVDLPATSAANA